MEIFEKFETVDSLPLLAAEELDSLILSDLHVGIEIVQTSSGILMPKVQTQNILEELGEAKELSGMSNLIINGDLKHSFTGRHSKEKEEVEKFLRKVSMVFEKVTVVKGNHDSAVEHRAEDFKNIEVRDELRERGFLIVHGHEEVEIGEDTDYLVLGHEHPALELKDDAGVKEKIPCFLYGEKNGVKTVVLPAYSEIASGTSINSIPRNQLLTPYLKDKGVMSMKAIGIDREAGVMEFPELEKIS